MIDDEFLNGYGITLESVPQIQEEIMNSIRNNEFTEVNKKYHPNVIEHLCNDLVTQNKLGRSAKPTSAGIQFPYFIK